MTTPRHETTPDPTGMNHDPTTAPVATARRNTVVTA